MRVIAFCNLFCIFCACVTESVSRPLPKRLVKMNLVKIICVFAVSVGARYHLFDMAADYFQPMEDIEMYKRSVGDALAE